MFFRFFMVALEILFITVLDYKMASNFYSLDVLYCLPVIQVARFSALGTHRRSDSQVVTAVAIFCALAWSGAEAAVTWPSFPISAFLLNTLTRGVTFTVIGRVVIALLNSKEYSMKDSLTGLANRSELIKRLEANQMRSERSGKPYTLLNIDIDNFRAFNDKRGHTVGDEALIRLAETLQDNSRNIDIAARLDSDEFVVLLPDTDMKSSEKLLTRIAQASERLFTQQGWEISLSFSQVTEVGKARTIDQLLHDASRNMHTYKNNHRSKQYSPAVMA